MFVTDIFIFRRGFNNETIVYTPKEGGIVEEKAYKIGDNIQPSLTIEDFLLPLLMQAFEKKGIKVPEKSFLEGKLEAQEQYIGDLRHLLKLDKRDKK